MRHASSALATLVLLAASAAARPDGVGGHHHAHHAEHGATAPAAAEPLSGYATPDAGYAAPDAGYASPDVSSGYGAPESGYGEPSYGYTATGTGGGYVAETAGADGMSMIIIPLLIAAALFLLFPSVVNVDVNATQAGRKKRAVTDETPAAANMLERVQDMYMAVLESEECVERIVCEMGGLVADAGYSKQMTKQLELFAPAKYSKMMKTFNHGKDCKKNNKCGFF